MEIASIPGPDRMITDEDLKNRRLVSKRYRNRRIGDFLKELHMVEGRNTGIPTILKAMAANGSPLPVFETDEEEKPARKRRSRNDLKVCVLNLLREQGELSTSEIVQMLGYKYVSNTLRSIFRELISEELVEYTIPGKINSRNQKLRLK